jgi:hypothetical protein
MRNLLIAAAAVAVVVAAWPFIPGLPSFGSIFGGMTHTITVNPVPDRAR